MGKKQQGGKNKEIKVIRKELEKVEREDKKEIERWLEEKNEKEKVKKKGRKRC